MPKVSIVLPTYNGERYLRESIDSILSQSFTDWELIIVNDCSSDRTADIAEEYAASNNRIQVIHNIENQKLPKSLNIGFSAATGKYLTWTSDDNLYMPDALSVMAEYLDLHKNIYMVRTDMNIIDQMGRITGKTNPYSDEKLYTYNCLGACFLYRKEVRDEIGDYDADTFCVEDYDYWLRVLQKFGKIISINQILYQYRRHEGSLSETRKKQVSDELTKLRIRHLEKIFNVLQENPGELCRIYYDMKKSEYMTHEVTERFQEILPEVRGELPIANDRKYIIFGAGTYGQRAAEMLSDRVAFFADSNPAKAEKIKCGLRILPFEKAIGMREEYHFLIAIAKENIYEMITQLRDAGIKEYSVFTC